MTEDYGEIGPEQRLWLGAIKQAIDDATTPIGSMPEAIGGGCGEAAERRRKKEAVRVILEARDWLMGQYGYGSTVKDVCEIVGIDYPALREKILELKASRWQRGYQ